MARNILSVLGFLRVVLGCLGGPVLSVPFAARRECVWAATSTLPLGAVFGFLGGLGMSLGRSLVDLGLRGWVLMWPPRGRGVWTATSTLPRRSNFS